MKKIIRIVLTAVIFVILNSMICNCIAIQIEKIEDGWEYQYSVSYSLKSMDFINLKYGWVVGDGLILNTSDGGINWINQMIGVNPRLNCVDFINNRTGWCGGYGGIIYNTTNGGLNWSQQLKGSFGTITDISFSDTKIGWAISDTGVILKTVDGGNTWSKDFRNTHSLYCCCFIDNETGWIGGNQLVLSTINGGMNWTKWTTDRTIYGIDFLDNKNGWMAGTYSELYPDPDIPYMRYYQSIYHTSDGGHSWFTRYAEGPQTSGSVYDPYLTCLDFINDSAGYVGTTWEYPVLHTINAGNSWGYQVCGFAIRNICFIDENNGWAVDDSGILHTSDGGGQDIPYVFETVFIFIPTLFFVIIINVYKGNNKKMRNP